MRRSSRLREYLRGIPRDDVLAAFGGVAAAGTRIYRIGSGPLDNYASYADMLAAETLQDGDTISFRKGETFNEQVSVPCDGLTLTSHGTGDNPRITSAVLVSGWSKTGGQTNVYQCSLSGAGSDLDTVWASEYATVYEGVKWLTKAASVAEVDAAANSCYYDTAVDILYVHTFDSDNPATNGLEYRAANYVYALKTDGLDSITVENIDVYYPCHSGFFTGNATLTTVSDGVILTGCLVYGGRHAGFAITGTNHVLNDCTAVHQSGDSGGFTVANVAGQDMATDGVTLNNCVFGENTLYGRPAAAFSIEYDPANVTINSAVISGIAHTGFSTISTTDRRI